MKKSFIIAIAALYFLNIDLQAQGPGRLKTEDLILYIKQSDLYSKASYIREEMIRTHQEANDYFVNESMNENENALKLNRYNSSFIDLKDSYNKLMDLWAYNLSLTSKYNMNSEIALNASLADLESKLNHYKETFSTVSNSVAFGGVTEILAISGMVVELIKFIDNKAKEAKAKRAEILKQNITEPLKITDSMISIK
ncbi:MAG: hypothetical protein IPQ10_14380 [Saprospiraceae bacterium]|nr:hypothetical protein [Saprospiraceae bacterium]